MDCGLLLGIWEDVKLVGSFFETVEHCLVNFRIHVRIELSQVLCRFIHPKLRNILLNPIF